MSHKSAIIGLHGLTSWIANLVDSDNDHWTSNLEPNSTYSTTESPSLNHTCDTSTCMVAIVDFCCNQENSCIQQITSKLHKRRYYQPMEWSRATEDGQAFCIEDIRRIMHGCISSAWFKHSTFEHNAILYISKVTEDGITWVKKEGHQVWSNNPVPCSMCPISEELCN